MEVGFIGLGKLGLPVALTVESKGHSIIGYDTNPAVKGYIENRHLPYTEEGIQPLLDATKMRVAKCAREVVESSDIIFLPIQTPHDSKYEGVTRLPEDRKDFEYSHLEMALADVSSICSQLAVKKTVAVISTCLPGTYERRLKSLINKYVDYVYTPQFIAMGTVIDDYLNPEFNLIGVESVDAADQLESFYATINNAPNIRTDITTAEAIKVSYNTFVTMKTVLANTWGELCHKLGANFEDVFKAWSLSQKRLISPKYLKSGVGDGGGCHPRDNIALSYIAQREGLSHNIFEDLMKAREHHMEWLADEAHKLSDHYQMPVLVLGRSFKPETNIETGSSSKLLVNIYAEKYGKVMSHAEDWEFAEPCIVVIGTRHKRYNDYRYPLGTVILDPFNYIENQDGVTIISIGAKNDISQQNSVIEPKKELRFSQRRLW